jgi:hypothetical protein
MNTVEDRVRQVIGDLTLQLIMAQQRVAELELALADNEKAAAQKAAKPNGKAQEAQVQ